MRTDVGFPQRPAEQRPVPAPAVRNQAAIWLGMALLVVTGWHWYSSSSADAREDKICTALTAYTAIAIDRPPPPPDLSKADDRYKDITAFHHAEMWDEYRFMSGDNPLAERFRLTRAALNEIEQACGVER